MILETDSTLAVELTDSSAHRDQRDHFTIQFDMRASDGNIPLQIALQDISSSPISEHWSGLARNQDWHEWNLFQNQNYIIARVPTASVQSDSLDQVTEASYVALFDCMQQLDYPYLCRTWNYFPEITQVANATHNRYQLFCTGRSRAYQTCKQLHAQYPAATVVGSQRDELCIYFIASKLSGYAIENSKQVSAYNYPKKYSTDAPLFSRAFLHKTNTQTILFISGTASIRGHTSQHEDDVCQQTSICLDNIKTLLETSHDRYGLAANQLKQLSSLKVYLKYPHHLETVKNLIHSNCGSQLPTAYLQGHLCRDDLLVEIEAVLINNH